MSSKSKTLSLVIPCYTANSRLADVALQCVKSYSGKCDEIVIIEDGGYYNRKLRLASDIYIKKRRNTGFTDTVNVGLKLAKSDFIAVVNSDTTLFEGNLYDLCVDGKVSCPEIVNQCIPGLAGPFFVISREILNRYGLLDDRMKNFCSDSEYEKRVGLSNIVTIPSVKITHRISETLKETGKLIDGSLEKDRKIYEA